MLHQVDRVPASVLCQAANSRLSRRLFDISGAPTANEARL